MTPLLELEGITKAFPAVLANDGISFSVAPGEIHAILGENGAGKSTLVKIIYGLIKPDSGSMRLNGEPYRPSRPSEARASGVGMVFQHFSLFEAMTVLENISIGISAALTKGDLRGRIVEVSTAYGLKIDPGRIVGTLSVGERQRVEIVRCLLQSPSLIIMDEPTSVLTPHEAEVLFETLRRLASEGRSILYISHKLEEIRALCDRATILRGGRVVGRCVPRQETARGLAEMMMGAALLPPQREPHPIGETRLKLNKLSIASEDPFGVSLDEIELEVRSGEIVGIAGVAGNGQNELMAALIGEVLAPRASSILVNGSKAGLKGPNARRALGMCFVPEERLGHGTAPDMSLTQNATLSALVRRSLTYLGFVKSDAAAEFADEIIVDFNVKSGGRGHAARSLSGGNLQKFMIGREILQQPLILVASQPTWGVDAGAASAIHKALLRLTKLGAAILVISQDLEELFAISTRIGVIANGQLTNPEPVESLSIDAIGLAMGRKSERRLAYAEA
jgi:general nucleoside transport system ATP-binding protein